MTAVEFDLQVLAERFYALGADAEPEWNGDGLDMVVVRMTPAFAAAVLAKIDLEGGEAR